MAKNIAFICSFIVLMVEMMNVETVLCFHQLALTLSPASRRNLHVVHVCQERISVGYWDNLYILYQFLFCVL